MGTHARVVFKPDAQYVVAAPYPGIVPRVLVAIGQTVRPGQPLASFLSPQLFDARRALAEANSQARLAQQALVRDQSLYEDGIIALHSRWRATQARATEAAAMARARRAELASAGVVSSGSGEEVQLVASHQGIVSEVNAVPGTRVEGASPHSKCRSGCAGTGSSAWPGYTGAVPGERVEVARRGVRHGGRRGADRRWHGRDAGARFAGAPW
ncbi:efflux RND transporter periplasmic adaptor subunit [Cupriavidus basilensis]